MSGGNGEVREPAWQRQESFSTGSFQVAQSDQTQFAQWFDEYAI